MGTRLGRVCFNPEGNGDHKVTDRREHHEQPSLKGSYSYWIQHYQVQDVKLFWFVLFCFKIKES